jgi:hypothetical protein
MKIIMVRRWFGDTAQPTRFFWLERMIYIIAIETLHRDPGWAATKDTATACGAGGIFVAVNQRCVL